MIIKCPHCKQLFRVYKKQKVIKKQDDHNKKVNQEKSVIIASKRRDRWTSDEDEYLKENALLKTKVEIALELERTFYSVNMRMHVLGINSIKKYRQNQYTFDENIKTYQVDDIKIKDLSKC